MVSIRIYCDKNNCIYLTNRYILFMSHTCKGTVNKVSFVYTNDIGDDI